MLVDWTWRAMAASKFNCWRLICVVHDHGYVAYSAHLSLQLNLACGLLKLTNLPDWWPIKIIWRGHHFKACVIGAGADVAPMTTTCGPWFRLKHVMPLILRSDHDDAFLSLWTKFHTIEVPLYSRHWHDQGHESTALFSYFVWAQNMKVKMEILLNMRRCSMHAEDFTIFCTLFFK